MAKREPRWAKVFLKHLERTGNVRLAAEGAGVDYTTAYQRRPRHEDFAEAWEGALRLHAMRTAQDERGPSTTGSAAPSSPQHAPGMPVSSAPPPPGKLGEELNVRPDGKVIRGSEARWGKRAEETFLLELTTSANVRLAARAAGFSTQAVYKRRLKDPRFAAAWDAALETGKARVQAYLVEAATRTFDPDELPVAEDIPKVSIGEAINIARMGGSAAAKAGRGRHADPFFDGWEADRDEAEAARERIVDRIVRLREQMDSEEQESGLCHACGQALPVGEGRH